MNYLTQSAFDYYEPHEQSNLMYSIAEDNSLSLDRFKRECMC